MAKKEKKEKERKIIEIFWKEPIDRETIVKIFNIVLNSKSKGILIFELFILLLIIAWIIALIKYLMF